MCVNFEAHKRGILAILRSGNDETLVRNVLTDLVRSSRYLGIELLILNQESNKELEILPDSNNELV
jgi:hypothetical protein